MRRCPALGLCLSWNKRCLEIQKPVTNVVILASDALKDEAGHWAWLSTSCGEEAGEEKSAETGRPAEREGLHRGAHSARGTVDVI